jgi:rubredoxin
VSAPVEGGHFFEGSFGGNTAKIGPQTRLECKICWHIYDPAEGCAYWQIAPGTPLPICPTTGPARNAMRPSKVHGGGMNPEAQDQGARFEAVFAGIATTRMAGVPVLNPALGVAMRGWQAVEPFELGVLVTPWFMNLLAVPQAGGPAAARGKGASGPALGRL